MIGLWELHEEFPEALEHELISLGLRWRQVGTDDLSWHDLKVIVSQAPLDGALTRARHPDEHLRVERLLEIIHYQLSVANVQRGNTSRAPKTAFPPLPEWANPDVERLGSAPIPIPEMAEWLGGDFLNLI